MKKTDHYMLRVAIIHHGTIIQEKIFEKTRLVTIGEDLKNDFIIPAENLPPKFPLFKPSGKKAYTMTLTRDLIGKLNLRDENRSVGDFLKGDRQWIQQSGGFFQAPLATGDWGLLSFGNTGVFFQCILPEDSIPKASVFDFNPALLATFIISFVFQVALLALAARFGGIDQKPSMDLVEELRDSSYEVLVDAPSPEELQEEEELDDTGKRADGEEGKFGDPDSEFEKSKVPKRDGKMVSKIDVKKIGLNDLLSDNKLKTKSSLSSVLTNSASFSNKIAIAMSGTGIDLQIGRGNNGMGFRGNGPGGGGTNGPGRLLGKGDIDTGGGTGTKGKLGRKRKYKVKARVNLGNGTQQGFCARSNVRRVVGRRAGALRACYEQQLQIQPKLAGKVVVRWTINTEGRVSGASIASSSLKSSAVHSCILRRVRFMRFEKPKGGICIISWPFVFRAAGG